VKVIFEALPLDPKNFLAEVDALLKDAGKSGKQGYESTTRGWDHKIAFDIIGPFSEGDDRKIVVGPKVGAPTVRYSSGWTWDQNPMTSAARVLGRCVGVNRSFPRLALAALVRARVSVLAQYSEGRIT